jgi:hypothetical protein
VLAVAFGAYHLGRADQEAGVDRLTAPALSAADANTIVGLEPGTTLPQERQTITRTGTVEDRDVYYPGTEALDKRNTLEGDFERSNNVIDLRAGYNF